MFKKIRSAIFICISNLKKHLDYSISLKIDSIFMQLTTFRTPNTAASVSPASDAHLPDAHSN